MLNATISISEVGTRVARINTSQPRLYEDMSKGTAQSYILDMGNVTINMTIGDWIELRRIIRDGLPKYAEDA